MSVIERTEYSAEIKGGRGNYKWPVRFDISTGGYLGISQTKESGGVDRVLLSPAQVEALQEFITGQ